MYLALGTVQELSHSYNPRKVPHFKVPDVLLRNYFKIKMVFTLPSSSLRFILYYGGKLAIYKCIVIIATYLFAILQRKNHIEKMGDSGRPEAMN